jgi:26S proteasome regulatory subunit N9
MSTSSSYADVATSATEHLESMAALHPELGSLYLSMSSLLSRKLYHQLTLVMLSFVSDSANVRATSEGTNSFLALYHQVVLWLDKRLNPLSLSRIAGAVSASLMSASSPTRDATAAKAVLENLLARKDPQLLGPIESIYVESKLHLLNLKIMEESGVVDTLALETTKNMLSRNRTILQEISTISRKNMEDREEEESPSSRAISFKTINAITDSDASLVHSAFYECAMTFRKCVGPPEEYYHEAMQFLHHTPVSHMDSGEKYQLATDLCLAALIGDGVYNFGDLVEPWISSDPVNSSSEPLSVLYCLENSENQWLLHLLQAAASGKVDVFQQTTQRYANQIASHELLLSQSKAVQEKVTLLALVQTMFEKPSKERTFAFEDIAQAIHMPVSQVEYVLIRAMSVGLIQGIMDQVDGTIMVSWVMPRSLNRKQIQSMKERFEQWTASIDSVKSLVSV